LGGERGRREREKTREDERGRRTYIPIFGGGGRSGVRVGFSTNLSFQSWIGAESQKPQVRVGPVIGERVT